VFKSLCLRHVRSGDDMCSRGRGAGTLVTWLFSNCALRAAALRCWRAEGTTARQPLADKWGQSAGGSKWLALAVKLRAPCSWARLHRRGAGARRRGDTRWQRKASKSPVGDCSIISVQNSERGSLAPQSKRSETATKHDNPSIRSPRHPPAREGVSTDHGAAWAGAHARQHHCRARDRCHTACCFACRACCACCCAS
jgi:hypothetical protein